MQEKDISRENKGLREEEEEEKVSRTQLMSSVDVIIELQAGLGQKVL